MKEKKVVLIVAILAIVMTILGSTFAYFKWATNASQSTAVTFAATPEFSCSADGGGNITPGDKKLAPAPCTDTDYAIQRTITVSPVLNQAGEPLFLDLWLNVNSISANLSATENFKYALTTSSNSCTSGTVVVSGDFTEVEAGDRIPLLTNKVYSSTATDTYYLWIWLDSAETDPSTMSQSFNFSLDGSCTNGEPEILSTVYTASRDSIDIGELIPVGVPVYDNYQDAVNGFGYNVFLKHTVREALTEVPEWCIIGYDTVNKENTVQTGYCYWGDRYMTESECEEGLEYYLDDYGYSNTGRYIYFCAESSTQRVVSTELGFIKDNNVYYLSDWDAEDYDYEAEYTELIDNVTSIFGSNNCYGDWDLTCDVSPWHVYIGDFWWHTMTVEYNGGSCTFEPSYNSSSCYFDTCGDDCT